MRLPLALSSLLFLAMSPACVVVVADEGFGPGFGPDEDCPRECVNPGDESCWHEPGSCGDDADIDDDGVTGADEVELGTDPSDPDTDGDGTDDGAELACDSDPLDPATSC